MSMSKRRYYSFYKDDYELYPQANVYVIMSQRGIGKTYGMLKESYERGKRIIYMKRTIEDVNTICAGDELADINPYKPINRDIGTNIRPCMLKKGIGYFKNIFPKNDGQDEHAEFVSYLAAMNALKVIRGVDFSDADFQVLDEFVPTIGDLTVRKAAGRSEGEQLLDCYMTFNRDREDRGLDPLKLVLFSNTDDIMCPIVSVLEIGDMIANLAASGQARYYDEDRRILIHHVTDKEYPITEAARGGMATTMAGTAWAAKAYGGDFVNNDFTCIDKRNLAHSRCIMHVIHKNKHIYVYENQDNGALIFSYTPHQCKLVYDFNREADRLRYLHYENAIIRQAIMNDEARFEQYTMYDLFINFTKNFGLC